MSEEEISPFWASPPYILLTDVLQLDKIKPWNVDVGKLVAGFIREMKRLGDIDFRISGSALYSASVIFMKKTRELVELGIDHRPAISLVLVIVIIILVIVFCHVEDI